MTLAISSFIAPVAPAQPVNAPVAPPQHNEFAQMLGQRQAMVREQNAHAAEWQAADKAATPEVRSEPAAAAPKALSSERPPAKADKPKAPVAQAAARPPQAAEAQAADKAAATDDEPVDPALAEWLAALNLPSPTLAPELPAAGGKARQGLGSQAGETDTGLGKVVQPAGKGVPADAAQAVERADKSVRDVAGTHPQAATAAAEARSETAWQAMAEQIAAPQELPLRPETAPVGAAGFAAPLPTPGRAGEPAPATVVHLPTPATAPEFTQSLGVQISVLARDGVQQAELHLNPAEMGPISVQIALDGTQAQVNFGADSADTRQIIENGLPELASALRDAGFTLSGGGVHGQASGRGEGGKEGSGHGPGRSATPGEAEVTPRRTQARVSAGGVDLYA